MKQPMAKIITEVYRSMTVIVISHNKWAIQKFRQMKQPMAEIITEVYRSMTVILSHITNGQYKNLDR